MAISLVVVCGLVRGTFCKTGCMWRSLLHEWVQEVHIVANQSIVLHMFSEPCFSWDIGESLLVIWPEERAYVCIDAKRKEKSTTAVLSFWGISSFFEVLTTKLRIRRPEPLRPFSHSPCEGTSFQCSTCTLYFRVSFCRSLCCVTTQCHPGGYVLMRPKADRGSA
jgi:hypothetical protein